nr:hypothetical protein [Tanacetum cinerariifolium]
MELDEHVPVYVLEPEHPEYHAPSDDDVQVEDDDEDPEEDPKEDPSKEHEPEDDNEDPEEDPKEDPSKEHEPEDDNEDPEEDPNKEHEPEDSDETEPFEEDEIAVEDDDEDPEEDPKEDPSKEHEPEDDNEDPEEDPNKEHEPEDSDETEPFEDDEIAVTPPPPRHRGARISVRHQTPMAASTQTLIDAFASGSSPFPLPPISPAYDQAHLGHRAAMIRRRDDILEEDMPPRRRFIVIGPPPGCDVAESSAAAAARAPRSQYKFVDTVEAGHGLIRSPGHDTRTIVRAADKAEDVGYVRALQASERRMMTSIEEVNLRVSYQAQRQSVENLTVTQMMCIHTLEARARTDTVENVDSSC